MTFTQIDILEGLNLEPETPQNTQDTQVQEADINFDSILKAESQAKEKLQIIEEQVQVEIIGKLQGLKKAYEAVKLFLHFSATSAVIFVVLLLVSNYKAYYVVAENYLNPGELENNQKEILSSVSATSITSKKEDIVSEIDSAQVLDDSQVGARHSIKKLIAKSNKTDAPLNIEITPFENRVVIPKIGKNVPMIEVAKKRVNDQSELQDIFMKELQNGVVRYPGSAKPGKEGNTFVFGHSSNFPWVPGEYNDVFALLDKVVYGDSIILYYNQKKYVYTVREKQVIRPGDVSVLKRNNSKNELSLMTCWPIGTTLKRLVVTGELTEEGKSSGDEKQKDTKMAFNK